jgi:glutathione S-transferase
MKLFLKYILFFLTSIALPSCHWFGLNKKEISGKERIVYGLGISPYVRKVLVALNEKNLPYTLEEVYPLIKLHHKLSKALNYSIDNKCAKASPLGKIPTYSEGTWSIADSSVICAYIDRQYPTPALYPTNSHEYAQALWFEKYADEVLSTVIYPLLIEKVIKPQALKEKTDQEIVKKSLQELPPLLDYLETAIDNKEWLVGTAFSIADIAIVTQFISLDKAGEAIDTQKWPQLSAYLKKVKDRESFKKSHLRSPELWEL